MKKIQLNLELILLFFGIPLLLFFFLKDISDLINSDAVVLLILSILCAFILLYLWFDKHFIFKRLLKFGHFNTYLIEILYFYIPSTIITTIFTYFYFPEDLFYLPKENFSLWLLIMFAYPLFSVLPQGILFRVFFFHRYKTLFPNRFQMIIASAVVFMFGHIIFNNIYALVLTLIGGFFFAFRYQRTNSWLISSFEHALYGNWMFTVGLGKFLIAEMNFS